MSGRAGRDGNEAHIHLLFGKGDVFLNTELLHGIAPDHDEMAQIYRSYALFSKQVARLSLRLMRMRWLAEQLVCLEIP